MVLLISISHASQTPWPAGQAGGAGQWAEAGRRDGPHRAKSRKYVFALTPTAMKQRYGKHKPTVGLLKCDTYYANPRAADVRMRYV